MVNEKMFILATNYPSFTNNLYCYFLLLPPTQRIMPFNPITEKVFPAVENAHGKSVDEYPLTLIIFADIKNSAVGWLV